MSVFDPAPQTALEARVAALEAANVQLAQQIAANAASAQGATDGVAGDRSAGDAASVSRDNAETAARITGDQALADQLGTEIAARVAGDAFAVARGNYAQEQGDYAKAQGDAIGDIAEARDTSVTARDQAVAARDELVGAVGDFQELAAEVTEKLATTEQYTPVEGWEAAEIHVSPADRIIAINGTTRSERRVAGWADEEIGIGGGRVTAIGGVVRSERTVEAWEESEIGISDGRITAIDGDQQSYRSVDSWADAKIGVSGGAIVSLDAGDAGERVAGDPRVGLVRSRNQIAWCGNSREEMQFVDAAGARVAKSSFFYGNFANAVMGQRLKTAINLSRSGKRLDEFLTDAAIAELVATNAAWVLIGDCQNDISQLGTDIDFWNGPYPNGYRGARIQVEKLIAAGITPILKTETLSWADDADAGCQAAAKRWNDAVRTFARDGRAVLFDITASQLDPFEYYTVRDGYYLDNGGDDIGVHASNAGGAAAGRQFAALMAPLVPPIDPLPVDKGGCGPVPNPFLQTDSGGTVTAPLTGTAPANVRVEKSGDVAADVSVVADPDGYGNAVRIVATATGAGLLRVLHLFPAGVPQGRWCAVQRVRVDDASAMQPPWLKLQDFRQNDNREASDFHFADGSSGERSDAIEWPASETFTLLTPPMSPNAGAYAGGPWQGAWIWTEMNFAGAGSATITISRTGLLAA